MNKHIDNKGAIQDIRLSIDYTKRRNVRIGDDKNNSKLVVFGDSFFESWGANLDPYYGLCWTSTLANRMNKSLLNYAVSGTSLNYSVQMLFHYLDTEYDESDTIIFGITNMVRPENLLDDNHNGWHSTAWKILDPSTPSDEISREQYKYFKKDRTFWKTFLTRGMYTDDFKNQLRLVENYLHNIPNNTLILHSFEDSTEDNKFYLNKLVFRENFKYANKLNHLSDRYKSILIRQVQKYFTELRQNKKNPFIIGSYRKPKG